LNIKDHLLYELEKHTPIPFLGEDDPFEQVDHGLVVGESLPKTIQELIEGFKKLWFYQGQLEAKEENNQKTLAAKQPEYGDINMSKEVKAALEENGIQHLYIHQTEALQGLHDGHHVIVSTSTARYTMYKRMFQSKLEYLTIASVVNH
jgi:DEAD/DEAH box helicase domain-containing protein